mgnify:FL=1
MSTPISFMISFSQQNNNGRKKTLSGEFPLTESFIHSHLCRPLAGIDIIIFICASSKQHAQHAVGQNRHNHRRQRDTD